MNNRKTKNKRGKNPRQFRAQLIPEAITLKNGEPNPNYGSFRRVIHINFSSI